MIPVLRSTFLGMGPLALALSAAVHATLLAASGVGTTPPPAASDELVNIEVIAELDAPSHASEPEAAVPPRVDRPTKSAAQAYPVPAPPIATGVARDSNAVRAPAMPRSALDAPEATVETTTEETPHFTIAIGPTPTDADGAPFALAASAARTESAEPLSERTVDGQARLVRGLAPGYPPDARAHGVEGDVGLELVVGVSGAVESARVVHGVGHGLDESALRAVREYRFAPATKAGRAVRVRMGWSMQFRLQ